jgi:hypothetical protein
VRTTISRTTLEYWALMAEIAGAIAIGRRNEVASKLRKLDSLASAHLKLVRFPAHSPLPIAALPSMSLFPEVPFGLLA